MERRRHTLEQIVRKLSEPNRLQSEGRQGARGGSPGAGDLRADARGCHLLGALLLLALSVGDVALVGVLGGFG